MENSNITKKVIAKNFAITINNIKELYLYSQKPFTNGHKRSKAGQNEGSSIIFAFAKLHELSPIETLPLFCEHYHSVLKTPEGTSHPNIRSLMEMEDEDLNSIEFPNGLCLSPKHRIGHRYRDAETGETLDVWFPSSNKEIARNCLALQAGLVKGDFVEVKINSLDDAPQNAEDAYLRLHLLSECFVKPNEINLNGIFGLLNNVAWTTAGPVLPGDVENLREAIIGRAHQFNVTCIDKFPRMTDYVIPEGVRIGNADRVRLGAHLAPGTTIMHEGFVNFNAGTLGNSMVEGRISAGVLVGENTDIGGGASIMGTLSGGGKQVISMGQRNLLGANSGLGISLGDDCIVEAGLYLTAGTKVKMPDGSIVSARELSNESKLLFRRHSQTGAVEAIVTDGTLWKGLNPDLHKN